MQKKLSKLELNEPKKFFYPQPKYGRHGLEYLQYAVNRSILPSILSSFYTSILQSCRPLIPLCFSCHILSSSHTSILQSCHPLTRPFSNPGILSYHCAFLSYPVILLHVHSQVLSSSHPQYYCCPILSSYHRLILRACRHITSAFFKGTVSRNFLHLVFLMNQLPSSLEYCIRTVSNFFENSRR
jgi:hypothetical protein